MATLSALSSEKCSLFYFSRDNRAETTQLIAREFSMDQEIAGLAYRQLLELLSPDGRNGVNDHQLLVDFPRAAQNRSTGQRRRAH